jgi:hypothetical protein
MMAVHEVTHVTEDDFDVLPIAALLTDSSYQREKREALIKKILADGFDMNAAYPIIVSERPPLPGMADARYYIVDGQHRVEAAERSGETEVLCKIVRFQGSDAKIREQEAKLRRKYGERKADTPMEKFKSKLASGDDVALKIDRLVESYGGLVALSQSSRGIKAISTMEKLYARDALETVLRIIKTGWDTFDGRAGESASLEAIGWLIAKHPDLDVNHLTRRLRGIPPEAIHARAVAMQQIMGGSLWKNYYRAIIEAYNQRAPQKIKRLTAVEF